MVISFSIESVPCFKMVGSKPTIKSSFLIKTHSLLIVSVWLKFNAGTLIIAVVGSLYGLFSRPLNPATVLYKLFWYLKITVYPFSCNWSSKIELFRVSGKPSYSNIESVRLIIDLI